MLDANDRSKDIVTCETWSIGTEAEPESLPPKVILRPRWRQPRFMGANPLVPLPPIRFALFVVLETNTTF